MNDTQRNRLRMYKATHNYLLENQNPWSAVTACSDAVTALGTRITTIDERVAMQGAELGGHTQNKRQLREALNGILQTVADAAAAYARSTGDALLLAEVDLEPSAVARLSDQLIDDTARRALNAANGAGAALAPYGITATELSELDDAINAFDAAKAMPDVKRAERSGHTAALEPLFDETSEFLDGQLDPLMRRYKTSDPAFHAGYKAARTIIDLSGPGEDDEDPPEPEP